MRIERYLQDSAARDGARTAIVAGETRLSYARFLDLSTRMAATLRANGIGPGDRVLILLDNGWRAAVAIFATWIAGAAICPVNPASKTARLEQIARDCRPAMLIVEGRLEPIVQGVPELTDIPRLVTGDGGSFDTGLEADPLGPETHPDTDLAALIYTSGSTGEPKGVMLAHENMDAAARSITSYLENTASDVILVVLPLSFGYGLTQLVTAMRVGATLVIEKSFAFPQAIFEKIRDERVTGFPLVPTMAAMMLQARELDPSYFANLRYVTSAAAPLPLAHVDGLRAFLPQARLYIMYGQTECTRVSWLPPEELDTRRGSVGIAIPGTHAEVIDEAGDPLPPGAVGELVISGPHVMRGYWQNEAATRQSLRSDPRTGALRLYTGDLFTADADGYLTFVARLDDIIKSRGEKVAPKAVEDVLCRMPGIAEALVVGVPHDVLGQVVKAVVVATDPALTERDVMRFCARNLEDHMVPKLVEFRDTLPKTDSGKAIRRLAAAPANTIGSTA
ncbi:class I adenylate-forming enzyme family protein [Sinorhizobium sp. RAC02]|uniref:class I adenylate-forming enzyme family protein n=1 Tax=Sinorhizobium sp. RAC02 TaxID=1842534 RepID=UPI00083DCC6D|nr:class I adenylate-forming enzyme family protein [Sinorhizobium sp. RAC02]AOF93878.1 AMP-binding enzyme family protein [Sinorhizobium sp. RAC02]